MSQEMNKANYGELGWDVFKKILIKSSTKFQNVRKKKIHGD